MILEPGQVAESTSIPRHTRLIFRRVENRGVAVRAPHSGGARLQLKVPSSAASRVMRFNVRQFDQNSVQIELNQEELSSQKLKFVRIDAPPRSCKQADLAPRLCIPPAIC
jgi:hypothetical protein